MREALFQNNAGADGRLHRRSSVCDQPPIEFSAVLISSLLGRSL